MARYPRLRQAGPESQDVRHSASGSPAHWAAGRRHQTHVRQSGDRQPQRGYDREWSVAARETPHCTGDSNRAHPENRTGRGIAFIEGVERQLGRELRTW